VHRRGRRPKRGEVASGVSHLLVGRPDDGIRNVGDAARCHFWVALEPVTGGEVDASDLGGTVGGQRRRLVRRQLWRWYKASAELGRIACADFLVSLAELLGDQLADALGCGIPRVEVLDLCLSIRTDAPESHGYLGSALADLPELVRRSADVLKPPHRGLSCQVR